jgi:hypothetical protein
MTNRRKIPIDQEQVERMAAIGCTDTEIATVLNISEAYLKRRAAEALKRGRARLKRSLRRKQVQLAMKGSVPMLIWLGKQYLDQKDKQDVAYSRAELQVVEKIIPDHDDPPPG